MRVFEDRIEVLRSGGVQEVVFQGVVAVCVLCEPKFLVYVVDPE